MANRIQIRHGSTEPTTSSLLPYELGWDGNILYINNNGTIKHAALSTVGGTITGTINRFYNTVTDEPMFTLRSNNKDVIFFSIGHATSQSGNFGNYYKLVYKGTGSSPNNYLQLMASTSSTDVVAIQINENGNVTFNKGITINNGGVTISSTNGAAITSKNETTSAEIQLTTYSSSNYQGIWSRGYYNGTEYVGTSKWLVYRDTSGNVILKGNADTATKATQDADGNVISSTYLKLSVGGNVNALTVGNKALILDSSTTERKLFLTTTNAVPSGAVAGDIVLVKVT